MMVLGAWSMRGVLAAEPVPTPWNGINIGGARPPGSSRADDGTVTLASGGDGVLGGSDHPRFVYQALSGDGALTARVRPRAVERGNSVTAGLMARDSLASTSNFVGGALVPGLGLISTYRASGRDRAWERGADVPSPAWLKLLIGQEGRLFRMTPPHSLGFLSIVCVLTYLQAYYLEQMVPAMPTAAVPSAAKLGSVPLGASGVAILAVSALVLSALAVVHG